MLNLEEILEKVENKTIGELVKKNRELIEMKYNSKENNFTFGRTLSLGQWFGYILGIELAKELDSYEVLIDTCLTSVKQYETKNGSSIKKKRKTKYPDILIVKKADENSVRRNEYEDYIKENKHIIKKENLEDISFFNVYDVEAIIELKIDSGYVKEEDLQKSFNELNALINNREEYSFKKIYKKGEDKEYYQKNIVRFNSPKISKYLIMATESNHSKRISSFKEICSKEDFKYKTLTDNKKHIRLYTNSEIEEKKNRI